MSEWQPIETAPKDGTRVLLWFPDWGSSFTASHEYGMWQAGVWQSPMPKPTHWMPLPAPPPYTEV